MNSQEEYIIINKTHILKRIEELECNLEHIPKSYVPEHEAQIFALNQILSQSIPLIPEIEKAFDTGFKTKQQGILMKTIEFNQQKENYISNLKIDI